MLSLYVRPLTFDNKKNEILYSEYNIEWKKQVATVSMKKGLSLEAFINDKIAVKLVDAKSQQQQKPYVFAKFKYIPEDHKDREILLVCNPNDKKITTELYFASHIPVSESIIILNEYKKMVTKTRQSIKIVGQVLAFCVDISNYYLEEINLDEYIEFVQFEEPGEEYKNVDDDFEILSDEAEDTEDNEDDKDTEDEDENNLEEELDEDDDNDDEELDSDGDQDDNAEPAEEDADAEPEDDVEEEPDGDASGDEAGEEDAEEATDEATEEGEEAGEDAEIDGDIEIEKEFSDKPSKRKKANQSKTIKFSAGIDTSILFNILKPEDTKKPLPENELHLKRQINLKILKQLRLPFKIVQMIEKGIYNYTIEKCISNSIIPIWDNQEFVDIYISKSKNIYSNLNVTCYVKNKNLLDKVKSGKIAAYELAFMDTYKLFPEMWVDIIEEKTKLEKMLKESLKESATDLFECPRCHKRKTIYCEVQTRSSDEPMTKFITCLECGCKWKKY